MTEHDWRTSSQALPLLEYLYPMRGFDSVEPQSRASRLYLIACARRAWRELPGVCRAVVDIIERVYLTRVIHRALRDEVYPLAEELVHCRGEAGQINAVGRSLVELGHADAGAIWLEADIEPKLWEGLSHLVYFPFSTSTPHYRRIPEELHSAELVREIFANPFQREEAFDGGWRSETVRHIAQQAHASGDFSSLPILADALEEAGCDRDDLLGHLRSGGPHVRGCWALERVLI